MEKLKIKIIIGSTRQNRFSDKPAEWIFQEAKDRKEVEAEILDLRDFPMPFYSEPVSPAKSPGQYGNEVVERWAGKIKEGDGFLIVAPEYNHGYPAVLKNALDHLYLEWNNKPIGFISYGGVGGARAVEQLRQVVIELSMMPIRDSIHILAFWDLLDEQGNLKENAFVPLKKKADNFLNQMVRWTVILKKAREQL